MLTPLPSSLEAACKLLEKSSNEFDNAADDLSRTSPAPVSPGHQQRRRDSGVVVLSYRAPRLSRQAQTLWMEGVWEDVRCQNCPITSPRLIVDPPKAGGGLLWGKVGIEFRWWTPSQDPRVAKAFSPVPVIVCTSHCIGLRE